MRIGILSDVHGNVAGLQRTLEVLQQKGCERLIFLGDAVGYFPYAKEVCHLLTRAEAYCLMGNHEAMLLERLPLPADKEEILRLNSHAQQLPLPWLRQVENTGPSVCCEMGGVRMLLVHATPDDPLEGRFIGEPTADADVDIILCGHTHRPLLHHTERICFVNPGSCGYPRDHGTLLSMAVLDTDTRLVEILRLPFAFSPSLLAGVHWQTAACTRRTCPNPVGTLWEEPCNKA